MTKIALLEQTHEFENFVSFIKKEGKDLNDFNIIALELKLQAHLKKNGIAFTNTLPYLSNAAYKRILLKSEELLTYIESNFDFTDSVGIRHAYVLELLHYFELIFNYVAKIFEILQGVLNKFGKVELYASANKSITNSVFITNDMLLGALVEQFATANGVKFRLFYSKNPAEKQKPIKKISSANSTFYFLLMKVVAAYLNAFNKTSILLAAEGRGFERLTDEIKRKYPIVKFIFLTETEGKKRYLRYWGILSGFFTKYFYLNIDASSQITDATEMRILKDKLSAVFASNSQSCFEYYGINFVEIIREKAEKSFFEHLCKVNAWSKQIKNVLVGLNIQVIITQYGRGIWSVASEFAHKAGVPSLFVSHGTHPVPTDRYHEISLLTMCRGFMLGNFTHIAISTPVQEAHLKYFKKKYSWIKNTEIKTGPLIFADITKSDREQSRRLLGLKPDETILLHATSLKYKGTERYYFIESIDEYISGLSDIINLINNNDKNIRLIIRLHPGFEYMKDDIVRLLPQSDKYTLSMDEPFEDVLAAADLLISYSSTTIDEALLNKIPVLLYDKWDRYNHFQTTCYNNSSQADVFPVCYVNAKDKLGTAVNFMLNRIKDTKKEDINISNFKYMKDYRNNFFEFIDESLKTGGER